MLLPVLPFFKKAEQGRSETLPTPTSSTKIPTMKPIIHRVGPFLIYSYTVVLSLGILVAAGITGWLARKEQVEKWFDALLVCLVSGLIGGRFGFVVANWDYFQEQMASIPRLWQGGSSYFGALMAGLLGLWLWTQREREKRPFTTYSDLLAPGLALLCAFGWFACWLEGCAHGAETTLGPFAADLPDAFGIFNIRYQTQIMGMVWSLLVFFFALATRQQGNAGQLFWGTWALISLGHVGISFLRGDPMPMINSYRLDTILNGTFVLISIIFVIKYQNHSMNLNKM
ncbi:MAG: hypothetical protein CSB13_09295 [Chloroflexi bacterium]|nr:MAG: hypothetical protein CSB13_09295 [Chloroflexota bacterium]